MKMIVCAFYHMKLLEQQLTRLGYLPFKNFSFSSFWSLSDLNRHFLLVNFKYNVIGLNESKTSFIQMYCSLADSEKLM